MNFKRCLLTFFSILFICSCSDFLNRPPLDEISTKNYWRTADDLENYTLQFYPSAFPGHGSIANGPHREDANSDNLIVGTPSVVLNGERTPRTGRWIGEWSNIRAVNIFFDNYQKVEEDFDAYRHYVGEAHFFRAWFYFNLVKRYGDVPWYSTQLFPDSDEELLNPRDPRTVVVDSIIADLDTAIGYLDYRSEAGNNRLNKEAALAFKTRVALFEGTWQKYHANTEFGTAGADPDKYFQESVDAAEELINGEYTVGIYNPESSENPYYELFGLSDMDSVDEVLLYKAYNANIGDGNDINWSTTTVAGEMGVTWSLVSSYLDRNGDPYDYLELTSTTEGNTFLTTIAEEVDPRLKATIWTPGELTVATSETTFDKPDIDDTGLALNPTGFQVKKYSDPYHEGAGQPTGWYSETGYIIFRYGEVLLNYAEAKFELEGIVVYDELNLLRERVGMPAFTIQPQNTDPNLIDYGYSISNALYEIRRERRVETALEGRRSDDYRRWAAHSLFKEQRPKGYPFDENEFPEYNPPLDENGRIDYFQNEIPNGYSFREGQDYLLSIPQEELSLNPDLEQNPGW